MKRDDRGATAIEYGLIAALGTQLDKILNTVTQGMKKGTG